MAGDEEMNSATDADELQFPPPVDKELLLLPVVCVEAVKRKNRSAVAIKT